MERHFIPCKTSPDAANEEKICEITDKKNVQEIKKNLRRHINKLRSCINRQVLFNIWIPAYG